jgi:hypothetical protein
MIVRALSSLEHSWFDPSGHSPAAYAAVLIAAALAGAIQIEHAGVAFCRKVFLGAMVIISYPKLGGKSSICQHPKF